MSADLNHETYSANPDVCADRRLSQHPSAWVRQFYCEDMRPLIICRGPVRKEAMDVFEQMGITHYGILLSEKDSIVYTHALAPELRQLNDPERIHRVPDYSGADRNERNLRVQQILRIAREHNYNYLFAGYGFMAEDEALVSAIEEAGLFFIGPCARTVRDAGRKDVAKRTALENDISVTPGIDNLTALTLLSKYPNLQDMLALNETHALGLTAARLKVDNAALIADDLLEAAYDKGIDLISIDELGKEAQRQVAAMFREYPENRLRLKVIGGGGGKGQRILSAPSSFEGDPESRIREAATDAPERIREILAEVKANGPGDNKNVLIELNIDTNRHQEVQVIGNGAWCMTIGARDCSLQMHEQKLLEVSVTRESLTAAIARAKETGQQNSARALQTDLRILERMEDEAARFGAAVGLNSVSTFECIVDRDRHFFMEMNTRIQVEHRVSELCYGLRFANPDDPNDFFVVESLIEVMTLLAKHARRLPLPKRVPRYNDSVEVRVNATDASLSPHAGGMIESWSDCQPGEIRDDQGISIKNPDTGFFMKYRLAGAYDSNVALLLCHGESRHQTYERMAELLRQTKVKGNNLEINLHFHYGLLQWLLANGAHARVATNFVQPYLSLVGKLYQESALVDLQQAYKALEQKLLANADPHSEVQAGYMDVLNRKQTLILRPIGILFEQPHLLSGWLSLMSHRFKISRGKVTWLDNPIEVLADTYHYLNMDPRPDEPAAEVIWQHDNDMLVQAREFYQQLLAETGFREYPPLTRALARKTAPAAGGVTLKNHWHGVRAAHTGYQMGLQMLSILPLIGEKVGFFALRADDGGGVHIPEELKGSELFTQMKKILVPPPATNADELAAQFGGMYFPREAPELDRFVQAGDHFDAGDPLYVIEVMKMFNKIHAPFAGTVDALLLGDNEGVVVSKGQPLFKVTPDERPDEIDPQKTLRAVRECTEGYVNKVSP